MVAASDAPYASAGGDLPLMVHVTAPATLPAGYTFEAEINGDPAKLFTCEVVRGDGLDAHGHDKELVYASVLLLYFLVAR
jgi:hypothetical protein